VNSVILQGPDAIKAAVYIKDSIGAEAYDLGPDFGQDTARVWLPESTRNYVTLFEHWRDMGWFKNVGDNFRVVFDGPPFRMGSDISVMGTPL